jgi:hypothetical protein
MENIDQTGLSDELQGLARLHPGYNKSQLEQAHAQLIRHLEDAWQTFLRFEREGLLNRLNLTAPQLNPTVKPLRSKPPHQPSRNL